MIVIVMGTDQARGNKLCTTSVDTEYCYKALRNDKRLLLFSLVEGLDPSEYQLEEAARSIGKKWERLVPPGKSLPTGDRPKIGYCCGPYLIEV